MWGYCWLIASYLVVFPCSLFGEMTRLRPLLRLFQVGRAFGLDSHCDVCRFGSGGAVYEQDKENNNDVEGREVLVC